MVTKKATQAKSGTKSTAKSASASTSQPIKVGPEYLVVSMPEVMKEGANIKLLHVAASADDADKYIEQLKTGGTRLLCVLEKKKLLKRAPVMKTSEVKRNILTAI